MIITKFIYNKVWKKSPGKFRFTDVSKLSSFLVDGNGILKYVQVLKNPVKS